MLDLLKATRSELIVRELMTYVSPRTADVTMVAEPSPARRDLVHLENWTENAGSDAQPFSPQYCPLIVRLGLAGPPRDSGVVSPDHCFPAKSFVNAAQLISPDPVSMVNHSLCKKTSINRLDAGRGNS